MNKSINCFFRANILLIFIYFLILPVSAINITSCQVLNTTGVYNLTNGVTDFISETCMEITATGVTLDCQGYKITGNGTAGIYSNKLNTIIKNCILDGWDKGVSYIGSSNGLIKNTTIHSTNIGIYFSLASNNTIFNCVLDRNNYGLELGFSSTENKIYNNMFNNTNNVLFSETSFSNFWNTTKQKGRRIYSDGTYIGGNYWAKPDETGYSENCTDSNTDGFCDESYNLNQNNIDYLPLSNKFTPDLIPPQIKIISPLDNQIIDSFEIEINIYVNDSRLNYANISIEQNGVVENSIITTESGTFVVKLNVTKGGYYNITATAYDFAGNPNSTKVINILTPFGVSECSNLNTEGEDYFLEKDIPNSGGGVCIDIQANNITLDCRNHTIYCFGDCSNTLGIRLDNKENIVIKNCKIKNWTYGILLEDSSKNAIFNSMIFNNDNGIFLSSSSENKIYNNKFNNTNNVQFSGDYLLNFWNTTKQEGHRIYSDGTYIGGNYWAKPDGTGYSENCTDSNTDGFCDEPYDLGRTSFSFGVGNFIYKLFTGFFFFYSPTEKNTDYLPLSNKFTPDLTPPNTTITGVKEDRTDYTFGEWTNSSYVNITLTCTDLRSRCDKTFYCIENSTCEPDTEYLRPIQISGEGIHYMRFRSIDTEGNNETTKTETINILSTEQKILVNYPVSNSNLNNHTLTINITILDNQNLNYTNISICNSTGDLVNSTISFENGTFLVNLSVPEDGIYNIIASFYSIYSWKEEMVSDNIVIDTIPPVITSFEIGKEYKKGEEISAVCFATDNLEGNFEGVITGLDTSTTGEKTATCTATDDAGNSVTETRNYTVTELVCEENKKRCLGKELKECRNNSWVTKEICNYTCDSSLLRCIQKSIICKEGERKCYRDELQVCRDNTWETLKPCKFGCNETKCNPNPNPIKLPPMILIYIVILVFVVGSILVFVYIKLFEKPTKNLNKEILKLETKIKKLKLQGKNVSSIEKDLNLAKQDIRMGLLDMAKTRIKSGEKKMRKVK